MRDRLPAHTDASHRPGAHPSRLAALTPRRRRVVFGDIGTSPLYAFKEAFAGAHPLPITAAHIYGVLSLIFWSVMADRCH